MKCLGNNETKNHLKINVCPNAKRDFKTKMFKEGRFTAMTGCVINVKGGFKGRLNLKKMSSQMKESKSIFLRNATKTEWRGSGELPIILTSFHSQVKPIQERKQGKFIGGHFTYSHHLPQ